MRHHVSMWGPVVLWAGVIFALSSIPDLGTGLGGWDLFLRKVAHTAEYAILGALLLRAVGSVPAAVTIGVAYAVTDELHQSLVPGRHAARGAAGGRVSKAVAVDLDGVLGDTGPLWRAWLEDAERRYRVDLGGDAQELQLDARLGNWRALLQRFAEDHAPVYLRPDPRANAALRRLHAGGVRVGVFTPVPEPLARVAASHLGVARRLDALEAGTGARERLLERLGPGALVVETVDELASAAA